MTDTLSTCQPWGLTIKGGQQPYTVILAALNSPVITNVSMGSGNDVLTYIDRADPNGQLLGECRLILTMREKLTRFLASVLDK